MAKGIPGFKGVAQSVNIRVSSADAEAILSELRHMPDKLKKAEVAAVKKTMRAAETRIAKNVTAVTNLKSKEVKDRIHPMRQPNSMNPSGELRVRGSRIPLWKFNRSLAEAGQFFSQKGVPVKKRKPKTGAGWKIFKGESKTRHKGFFIARGKKTGQIHIMRRRRHDTGSGDPGDDYAIAYGISLVEIMKRKNITGPTMKELNKILEDNLRSQVDRFLKRKKNAR